MQAHRSKADIILEAWGPVPPDWIVRLAQECDAGSQSKAAARLGYSTATISYVLSGRYTGDLKRIEDVVRGALMAETIRCPVLGPLEKHTCRTWQRRAGVEEFVSTMRARMRRACRTCPHFAQRAPEAR